VIVDSSALLALVDSDEPDHSAVSLLIAGSREPLIVSPYDLLRCADIVERYGDQRIGVTDASNVVLAARYGTRRVATLDRRPFDVLRPLDGGRFAVLP